MLYFSNFPKTLYEVTPATFSKPAEYVSLTDITRNVRFKKEVIDNIVIYDYYLMKDNETMENISEKFYGSPYYHWVLMLLNEKFDYVNDMPLSTVAFEEFVSTKYNQSYLNTNYNGVPPSGLIVDIRDHEKFSREVKGTIKLKNSSTTFQGFSVSKYDTTLQVYVKQFLSNTGSRYNGSQIDFGVLENATPISAYEYETELNEKKRKIKIISESLLQLILKNFKDLM